MMTTQIAHPECNTNLSVHPCDWSPDDLRTRIDQERELRAVIGDYCRTQMIPDKHYYVLHANQKPVLSKEGALNLCSLFKVRISAADPCEYNHEDGHYSVRYRVILVTTQTEEPVANGDGFCSSQESKYAYRWMKATDVPESTDTAHLPKRQTRYGVQYRVPTPDLADHFNTVLKMACKRAIVAATLCLPLVSELFTQDREEPPTSNPTRRQQTDDKPPGCHATSSQLPRHVTPDQLKQLWRQIKHHGVDFEVFRSHLTKLGLQSSKELSPAQLAKCFHEIETRQDQAFQPHNDADATNNLDTDDTRARLFEALKDLQLQINRGHLVDSSDEPPSQLIVNLGQWLPRVARACENPETPEDQLQDYLAEVNQSLCELGDQVVMTTT